MGIADAGYANTVGAALEDTSLMGTCYLEHEWDIDGDLTFVLKVNSQQFRLIRGANRQALNLGECHRCNCYETLCHALMASRVYYL